METERRRHVTAETPKTGKLENVSVVDGSAEEINHDIVCASSTEAVRKRGYFLITAV